VWRGMRGRVCRRGDLVARRLDDQLRI
jgi:hypothetical protein